MIKDGSTIKIKVMQMTEVFQYPIPDGFLEAEERDGYFVSAKMKHVWAIELDILKSFIEVCDKYKLTYWIGDGTLLGAVRHKGFIPWDNDVDVYMPRKSFDRLLEIGSEAFKEPLFFQTPVTEKSRFFSTWVKIRNTYSTGASREEFEKGINCGIFIDVFCLDELPNNKLVKKLYIRKLAEISKMNRYCFGTIEDRHFADRIKHGFQKMVYKYVYHEPDAAELFRIYQKEAGRYAGKNKKEIALINCFPRWAFNRNDWKTTTILDFEDLQLKAPGGYDAILKKVYGDYMVFPEDKSTHDYIEFAPDVPYKEYFNKK